MVEVEEATVVKLFTKILEARAGEGEANMEELKPREPLRLVLLGGALKEKMLPVEVESAEDTEASDFPTVSPDFCKFLLPPLSNSGIPGTVSVPEATLAKLHINKNKFKNADLKTH